MQRKGRVITKHALVTLHDTAAMLQENSEQQQEANQG
jgi:hypothetical protein